MANKVRVGGAGSLFIGEDKTFVLEVIDADSLPVDITGWTVLLDVRVSSSAPTALISKTPAAITGTYNATRALNTQRASWEVSDDEMNAITAAGTLQYSMKRTDPGHATVLAYHEFKVEKATAP